MKSQLRALFFKCESETGPADATRLSAKSFSFFSADMANIFHAEHYKSLID